jgi:alkylation response protein AidB-like acyl-CoA dehydrogenase
MAARRGNGRIATGLAMLLQKLVRDHDVISVAISEPEQDLTRPKTVATPTEGGYRIDGHKIFATMSPAATMFLVSVRYPGSDGDDWATNAWVPAAAPGVTVNGDWDALGMRASGSGSVRFEGAQIPAMFLPEGRPAGIWAPRLFEEFITSGPMHAAASLGIAESAHSQIVERVRRGRTGTATVQVLTAENVIDLFAMRSALARAASLVDAYYARNPDRPDDCTAVRDVFAEGQAAKAFINQAAVRLVDRALTMSGGSGYLSSNRLSRLYRDVRAGGFMHPFGLNLAFEFIARTELDMEPPLPRISPAGGPHG